MPHSFPEFREIVDEPYSICPELIESYRRSGYVLVKGIFREPQLQELREQLGSIMSEHARIKGDLSLRNTYGKAFLQKGNLWRENEALKRFVFSRRLAGIAADLCGVSSVRLYHDQALYKESGGGPTPWHQDQYYWPLDTNDAVTCWMPLMQIDRSHGLLSYAAGSHKKGQLRSVAISDESQDVYGGYIEKEGLKTWKPAMLEAGDAVFHNGWCIHGADPNRSSVMREVMTVIYYPDGTELLKPDNEARRIDLNAFYPGKKGGDPAEGDLTPVLFP